MLKYGLSAALLVAALPAFAQPAPPFRTEGAPPMAPNAEIQQAGQAFGECLGSGMRGLAATVTPEAGAAGIVGACTAQRDALVQAAEAFITTLPEARRSQALTQMRAEIGGIEADIAGAIRSQRAAQAAAPAQ